MDDKINKEIFQRNIYTYSKVNQFVYRILWIF